MNTHHDREEKQNLHPDDPSVPHTQTHAAAEKLSVQRHCGPRWSRAPLPLLVRASVCTMMALGSRKELHYATAHREMAVVFAARCVLTANYLPLGLGPILEGFGQREDALFAHISIIHTCIK